MTNWFAESFRAKLMLVLIGFAVIVTMMLIIGYTWMLRGTMLEQSRKQVHSYAQLMNIKLSGMNEEYKYILNTAAASERVETMLLLDSLHDEERNIEPVQSYLSQLISKYNLGRIEGVYLRIWDEAPDEENLRLLRTSIDGIIVRPVRRDNRGQNVFSMYIGYHSFHADIACIEIKVYESELYELYRVMGDDYSYFILNGNYVMSSNFRQLKGTLIEDVSKPYSQLLSQSAEVSSSRIKGNDYEIQEISLLNGWRIVVIADLASLLSDYNTATKTVVIICLCVITIAIILSWILARSMTGKLKQLEKMVQRLQVGDFDTTSTISGRDEFHALSLVLDNTRKDLKRHIQDMNISHRKQRAAEMSVLRAQINSHFLLNSLASIKWLIMAGSFEGADESVAVLSSYLRVTLREHQAVISISTELNHIQNYLYLMKLRYRDSVQVSLENDPGIMRYQTLGFVLQPFVENSLSYAWRSKQNVLNIKIRTYAEQERLIFEISDDGKGMPPEVIANAFSDVESFSWGIRNVRLRLTNQWGELASVRIESTLGTGTFVRVCQPLRKLNPDLLSTTDYDQEEQSDA
jgi:sensor histidine kinase YesM